MMPDLHNDPSESKLEESDSWLSFGKDILVVIVVLIIVVTAVLVYGPSASQIYSGISSDI